MGKGRIKTEWIVLAGIIAILGLYLAFRTSGRLTYRLPEVAKVARETVTDIEVVKATGTVRLARQGGGWRLLPAGYPADEGKVGAVLDAVSQLAFSDLVSESRTYSPYGLDQPGRITVRARAGGKVVRTFEIGNAAPTYRHTYVMLPGDDRVYQAAGSFRADFDLPPEQWQDRQVMKVARTDISEVEIVRGTARVLWRKVAAPPVAQGGAPAAESWQLADGKAVNAAEVDALWNTVADLFCVRYWDGHRREELRSPLATFTFRGTTPVTLTLFTRATADATEYPALSSQSAFPFLLGKETAEKLLQGEAASAVKP